MGSFAARQAGFLLDARTRIGEWLTGLGRPHLTGMLAADPTLTAMIAAAAAKRNQTPDEGLGAVADLLTASMWEDPAIVVGPDTLTATIAHSTSSSTGGDRRAARPGKSGIVWLTTPRTATDIWGDTYNVRALQWLAFPDSTLVVQWSDHTVDDTFTRQLRDDPDMATLFAAGASIYDVSVIPDYPASSDTAVLLHADQPADVEQLRAMARAHINASTRDSEFHRNRRLAQIEGMDAAALLSMFTGSAQDRFLHALWTVTASRPAQTPRLRESTTKHARQRLARWAPDNPQDAYEHASRIEVHP